LKKKKRMLTSGKFERAIKQTYQTSGYWTQKRKALRWARQANKRHAESQRWLAALRIRIAHAESLRREEARRAHVREQEAKAIAQPELCSTATALELLRQCAQHKSEASCMPESMQDAADAAGDGLCCPSDTRERAQSYFSEVTRGCRLWNGYNDATFACDFCNVTKSYNKMCSIALFHHHCDGTLTLSSMSMSTMRHGFCGDLRPFNAVNLFYSKQTEDKPKTNCRACKDCIDVFTIKVRQMMAAEANAPQSL